MPNHVKTYYSNIQEEMYPYLEYRKIDTPKKNSRMHLGNVFLRFDCTMVLIIAAERASLKRASVAAA